MGLLSMIDRLRDRVRRHEDLAPIAESVRERLWWSNRSRLLRGLNVDGTPAAELRPSTLARRKGTGPPRVPMGDQSRAIRDYAVQVTAQPGRLSFVVSYPSLGVVAEYLSDGTSRMTARPMIGVSSEDREYVREVRRRHNLGGR